MIKKALKISIFLTTVLLLFSSCVKNVENCKFQPKVEISEQKNSESQDKNVKTTEKLQKMLENPTTSAMVSCSF